MLVAFVVLLLCGQLECKEISVCLGRLLAAALTFSLLLHRGVHF
jgi:hypothetical protein